MFLRGFLLDLRLSFLIKDFLAKDGGLYVERKTNHTGLRWRRVKRNFTIRNRHSQVGISQFSPPGEGIGQF